VPDLPVEQIPLFQLNLMIWLSFPMRAGKYHPVFRANGYELYSIAPPIPLSIFVVARAGAADPPLDMVTRPAPELVLRHGAGRRLLTLECKASSFGPDTTQARQAMGLISSSGPHLSGIFGLEAPDGWTADVLFAVSHPQQTDMDSCLEVLTQRLQDARIEATPSTSCGIELRCDGVYLRFARPERVPFPVPNELRVVTLEPGEDPRPLYVIPLDPSINARDEYGRRVVEERVRTALAYLIGSRLAQEEFAITWDELMTAAIEVWPLWRDRDATRYLSERVRRYVEAVLKDMAASSSVVVRIFPTEFSLEGVRPEVAARIRDYLSSAGFRRGELGFWQSGVQLGLEGV